MPTEPHPERAPSTAWRHDVRQGHVLHVERWGRAGGLPALVLHGGPGSGVSPVLRLGFDPGRYDVIAFDQRGAGRSTPAGGLEANTTAHLLADIRQLRRALGIERWLVVGGSWGAALAVAHAADEPDAVAGLLLRNAFLARPEDVDAFFADAPEPLAAGWRSLPDADADTAQRLAEAWWRHEAARAGAVPAAPPPVAALLQRYRIQSHYLRAGCWLQSPTLLERAARMPRVPALLVHGTLDRVCPPAGARALAAALPGATLAWAEGAGHDPTHPRMAALVQAGLDAFAAHRRFAPDA